ncbi:bifunctional diguanylate cyclase/phosphodiesterase, partial [Lapillicoccus sp.]|uniref:putative bifunctional diguanylate cyclase/phosphodiesterase n=1 Tax=Lapillicoccus sp. TaxID=1909287 RepID=UPI0025D732E4
FKRVNDTAGHAAGDAVLVETTRRMRAVLREQDTVARVGGDEFVVVVEPWQRTPGNGPTDAPFDDRALAVELAERLAEALRQPVEVDGVEHVVTASIGITYAGTVAVAAEDVLRDADAAMYHAKHAGKDRFEVFEDGLRVDLAERGRVEQLLRRAVSPTVVPAPRGTPTLAAAYQAVVDAATGNLVGFEALARLSDGEGGTIPPDVFIPVAESTALIRPLGIFMLDQACRQLAEWRRTFPGMAHVTMAVNVSALQAQHASLLDDVRGTVRAHGLTGSDLVLELTESSLLQAAHSTLSALQALRDDGVGIAIDDFGTGYASLRYLTTLPVSAVKVDRSFTAGLPHDQTCQTIVRAVIGLAAELNLSCIVEGVETEEQREALPAGVQLQGWLTGRPTLEPDIAALLVGTISARPYPVFMVR